MNWFSYATYDLHYSVLQNALPLANANSEGSILELRTQSRGRGEGSTRCVTIWGDGVFSPPEYELKRFV